MIAVNRLSTAVLTFPVSGRSLRRYCAAGVVMVGLGLVAAVDAQAGAQYPPSVQRVQATPAAEGSRGWSQDNCFYVFQGGAWRRVDMCRVMRSRSVYDTYTPSTGRWGVRMDESEAGWTGILDLNGGNPNAWLKFSNDGRTILAFDGTGWFNFSAAVAAQTQAQANAQAVYAGLSVHPALQGSSSAQTEEEREQYYEQQRLKKYYENKQLEEKRLGRVYVEKAREKDRLNELANAGAAANRAGQRAAADQAAAMRAAQRAQADQAAANRAAERAAADRAAANRRR